MSLDSLMDNFTKWVIIFFGILIIAAAFSGGFFFHARFFSSKTHESSDLNKNTEEQFNDFVSDFSEIQTPPEYPVR